MAAARGTIVRSSAPGGHQSNPAASAMRQMVSQWRDGTSLRTDQLLTAVSLTPQARDTRAGPPKARTRSNTQGVGDCSMGAEGCSPTVTLSIVRCVSGGHEP